MPHRPEVASTAGHVCSKLLQVGKVSCHSRMLSMDAIHGCYASIPSMDDVHGTPSSGAMFGCHPTILSMVTIHGCKFGCHPSKGAIRGCSPRIPSIDCHPMAPSDPSDPTEAEIAVLAIQNAVVSAVLESHDRHFGPSHLGNGVAGVRV